MDLNLTQQEPLFMCPVCEHTLVARYYHLGTSGFKMLLLDCDGCMYSHLVEILKGGIRS
jgi:C4-type Zn-finger protein